MRKFNNIHKLPQGQIKYLEGNKNISLKKKMNLIHSKSDLRKELQKMKFKFK